MWGPTGCQCPPGECSSAIILILSVSSLHFFALKLDSLPMPFFTVIIAIKRYATTVTFMRKGYSRPIQQSHRVFESSPNDALEHRSHAVT